MDKAPDRYKDMCNRLKRGNQRPPHIDESEWVKWQEHWRSESFLKNSEKGFANRKAGVAEGERVPPTHKAGSRSFHECAMMMAAERGVPVQDVPYYEVFDATHPRDASNFCNQKAAQVAEEYQRLLEASQTGNDTPASVPDQNNLFQSAAAGVSRKRTLFGLGSIGKSIASSSRIPRPPPPPPRTGFLDTPENRVEFRRMLREELVNMGILPQQNPQDDSPPHSPEV